MALSIEVCAVEVFASLFRSSPFFNITNFYHYDFIHPLKNFYTPLSGTPQMCVQSGPTLVNAGPDSNGGSDLA